MRALLSLLIPLFAMIGLAAQSAIKSSRIAEFPIGKVEAIGVCDVRPDAVGCWNMDGVRDNALTETVSAALRSGEEVRFRFGKKNRLLVARRPERLQASYRNQTQSYLSSNLSWGVDPRIELLQVFAEPDELSYVVKVISSIQSETEQTIAFRPGATAKIEGTTFEIGDARPLDPKVNSDIDPYGRAIVGKVWRVVLGSVANGEPVNLSYYPVDVDGNPIRFVDSSGKPISAVRALTLEPGLQSSRNVIPGRAPSTSTKANAANAYFQIGGGGAAFITTTNIDPQWIASLKIRSTRQASADLGPFPLDPK